jgi:organic radical activating enzyme
MTYPVHEIFRSFQGEGTHAGRAAVFVRLAGCPVRCPWCDSADTWRPAAAALPPAQLGYFTAGEILDRLAVFSAPAALAKPFAVITGGEPTIHDLAPLCDALRAGGFRVHLETCGAFPLRGSFDWITVSPKWLALPRPENLALASELKLIVSAPDEIARWADYLSVPRSPLPAYFLHPEWSRRADSALLSAITDWVATNGDPWRAGWQLHKLYGAE